MLKFPAPQVLFKNFGDSSLDFELRVYLRDSSGYFSVPTQMRLEIVKIFDEEGIVIPFPQRDVHIIDPRQNEAAAAGEEAESSATSSTDAEKNS